MWSSVFYRTKLHFMRASWFMNMIIASSNYRTAQFEVQRLMIDELPFSRVRSLKSKLLGVGRLQATSVAIPLVTIL